MEVRGWEHRKRLWKYKGRVLNVLSTQYRANKEGASQTQTNNGRDEAVHMIFTDVGRSDVVVPHFGEPRDDQGDVHRMHT